MALFAEWQAEYAKRGIATFPVNIIGRDKVPAVKGYLRAGLPASRQFALKFGKSEAFGFALKPNRITVLDVDTPDERVLADAMDRHGQSPLIVRSVSGGFHAWYRHSGEKRSTRPWDDLPIDVLGDGFVVAPPSRSPLGSYQIIEGSLDDLERLPRLQNLFLDLSTKEAAKDAANEPERVHEGKRNNTLWRFCMRAAHSCDSEAQLLEQARQYAAETFTPSLPDSEIIKVVGSAWRKTARGENYVGSKSSYVRIDSDEINELMAANQDSLLLLMLLRNYHRDRERFIVANAMHESLGWGLNRFRAARKALEDQGKIVMVQKATSATGAAHYSWP